MRSLVAQIFGWLDPAWLTGPILDKELRVSSRRKRNYILRLVYVMALLLIVALVWTGEMRSMEYYQGARQAARMAQVGLTIVMVVAVFQFIAGQIVAVVLLSNAINDEILNKTLGTLMSTPITAFQIVTGKMFSKLWQMLILLAVSVPILAIVRVFGGVPLDFLVAATCVTLTAMIHAAAYSLLFSIYSRHAYVAIIKTLVMGGVMYLGLPYMVGWCLYESGIFRQVGEDKMLTWFAYFNPPLALAWLVEALERPGFVLRAPFIWWGHCLVMLGMAALPLGLAMLRVRKVGMRQAIYGDVDMYAGRDRRPKQTVGPAAKPVGPDDVDGRIRRVKDSAVLWKETRSALLPRKFLARLGAAGLLVLLIFIYAMVWAEEKLAKPDFHLVMTTIYLLIGTFGTLIVPPTRITFEKERRSWAGLLCTPLSLGHILWAKFLGTLVRILPYWSFLILHLLIFTIVGYVRPEFTVLMVMLMLLCIVLLVPLGLFFSALCRKTTTAVILSIVAALVVTLGPILVCALVTELVGMDWQTLRPVYNTSPVVQAVVVIEGEGRYESAGYRETYAVRSGNGTRTRIFPYDGPQYDWPTGSEHWYTTAWWVFLSLTCYSLLGLVMGVCTRNLLRRHME